MTTRMDRTGRLLLRPALIFVQGAVCWLLRHAVRSCADLLQAFGTVAEAGTAQTNTVMAIECLFYGVL